MATHLTIEDYERLPQEMADWHELVDGELVDVSGNTGYHHSLRDFLIVLLRPLVRERRLGMVISEQHFDFDGNAHGPDVSFFGPEKCPCTRAVSECRNSCPISPSRSSPRTTRSRHSCARRNAIVDAALGRSGSSRRTPARSMCFPNAETRSWPGSRTVDASDTGTSDTGQEALRNAVDSSARQGPGGRESRKHRRSRRDRRRTTPEVGVPYSHTPIDRTRIGQAHSCMEIRLNLNPFVHPVS